MNEHPSELSSVPTRPSLLGRLKEGDDVQAWHEFYRVYGSLVRNFALQAGLTAVEADDVVQDVAIGVARNLSEFRYDPKACRFKTWLLNQSSWRIKNQIKRRHRQGNAVAPVAAEDDDSENLELERLADPGAPDLDTLFETQWRANLTEQAMDRVKLIFDLKQIQIFDLLVIKEWPGADVARALDVSLPVVYVTKHRVTAALKREVRRLERALEPPDS